MMMRRVGRVGYLGEIRNTHNTALWEHLGGEKHLGGLRMYGNITRANKSNRPQVCDWIQLAQDRVR